MGILYWTGTMVGYVKSLLIICLHLPIFWTKRADFDLSDVDVLQILTEEDGSTFTVTCVPDEVVPAKIVPDKTFLEDGMSRAKRGAESGFDLAMNTITCGAGKICSSDMCGPGQHPYILPSRPLNKPDDGSCKSVRVTRIGGLTSWCNNRINHGSDCPALYGDFYGFCLDFCCDFVFSTCECNCCECLDGAGGTCTVDCTSIACPGSG